MRRTLREYARPLFSSVAFVLTTLGALAIFVPDIQGLFRSGWALGWIAFTVATIAACLIWYSQDREIQKFEVRNIQHEKDLEEHTNCTESLNALKGECSDLRRDLAAARTQVRMLQKPVPTARDLALFARLTEEWPWGAGTLFWLRNNFSNKTWGRGITKQLISFVDLEGELYFEDTLVNKALEEFRTACIDLVDWLVTESSPSDHNAEIQVVHDETYRRGGYEEYLEVRKNGDDLADRVVDAWRRFERVGRSRSL